MAGGRVAFGYEATVLPDLCQVVIEAHRAGIVDSRQSYLVERAETLLLAFAKVGVIALVDEATGYQEERDRQELRRIFEAYISEDLRPWTKRFPDGFFEEIYRLHNWRYEPGNAQRPAYVGKLINRYVYERLPVGVLEALRVRNPTNVAGRRRHRHHQYLTTNTGDPHLDNQIQKVWTLLQASESMSQFDRMIRRVFQLVGDQIEMDGLDVPD